MNGDPGTVDAVRTSSTMALGWVAVATSRSGSTSIDQSRSVTEFHCDDMPRL